MPTNRRNWLKGSGLALLGSGFLSRVDAVAAQQSKAPPSLRDLLKQQATGASEKLLLAPQKGEEGPPAPATADRLPLEWNKATVARFKSTLAEQDIQAFLVPGPAQHHLPHRLLAHHHRAAPGHVHEPGRPRSLVPLSRPRPRHRHHLVVRRRMDLLRLPPRRGRGPPGGQGDGRGDRGPVQVPARGDPQEGRAGRRASASTASSIRRRSPRPRTCCAASSSWTSPTPC